MNSTSVGVLGLSAVVVGIFLVVSLAASFTAYVLYKHVIHLEAAVFANLAGAITMTVVVISMLTHGPMWKSAFIFNPILAACLSLPTFIIFAEINKAREALEEKLNNAIVPIHTSRARDTTTRQ